MCISTLSSSSTSGARDSRGATRGGRLGGAALVTLVGSCSIRTRKTAGGGALTLAWGLGFTSSGVHRYDEHHR